MRFLVASDKFKGSLTAPEACRAMARGILKAFPKAEVDECPIADGGEGFVNSIASASEGEKIHVSCHDAVGRAIVASYALLKDNGRRIAVLEMAEAAGLWRLGPNEHFPLDTSTYGVGEMLLHAARVSQPEEILIGIGGSATNDGGAGMLAALGAKFYDKEGKALPAIPRALKSLDRVDLKSLSALPPITVACDVTNPLFGQRGATRVYGPQKGATEETIPQLEAFLELLVGKLDGANATDIPGAGAAGGLGFAFHHVLNAELVPGFELVAKITRLAARVAWADCVITGEGSLDLQSLSGKGPAGVAIQAILAAKPIIALVGRVDDTIRTSGLFHHITAVLEKGYSLPDCLNRGAEILEQEAACLPWDSILQTFGHRTP